MEAEIQTLIKRISSDLQTLEELLQAGDIERVEIRFPRGIIRRADEFKNRLIFIQGYVLKTNVAYHLMLSDVYRWILNRFDISLTAKEMLIKEGISLIGNIIESIVKYIATNIEKPSSEIGFKRACTIIAKHGVITSEQKEELTWIWGMRCKEHILNLKNTEYNKYTIEHYNKAIRVWHNLESALQDAKKKGRI